MPLTAEQQQEIQDRNVKHEQDKLDPDRIELEVSEEPQEPIEEVTSELEQQARADGWVPLDEWGGSKDDWVDAKEFVFRGELMGRIRKQSNVINKLEGKVNDLTGALKELGEHNKKIAEQERKKAIKELRDAKREAFEEQDFDTMETIDDKIDELKAVTFDDPEPEEAQPQATEEPSPDVVAWLDKNDWYKKDIILQGAMNTVVGSLLAEDPSLESDPTALLNKAAATVRKELPHKFKTEDEEEAPRQQVMEPTSRSTSRKGKQSYTARHLNDEQKRIGQTFVRSGAFSSLDEYAADLAKIGELDAQKGS